MQLYVNKDHAITERIVRHAEERGVKGELYSLCPAEDAADLLRVGQVSSLRSTHLNSGAGRRT